MVISRYEQLCRIIPSAAPWWSKTASVHRLKATLSDLLWDTPVTDYVGNSRTENCSREDSCRCQSVLGNTDTEAQDFCVASTKYPHTKCWTASRRMEGYRLPSSLQEVACSDQTACAHSCSRRQPNRIQWLTARTCADKDVCWDCLLLQRAARKHCPASLESISRGFSSWRCRSAVWSEWARGCCPSRYVRFPTLTNSQTCRVHFHKWTNAARHSGTLIFLSRWWPPLWFQRSSFSG